jgi:hypothetical protein
MTFSQPLLPLTTGEVDYAHWLGSVSKFTSTAGRRLRIKVRIVMDGRSARLALYYQFLAPCPLMIVNDKKRDTVITLNTVSPLESVQAFR